MTGAYLYIYSTISEGDVLVAGFIGVIAIDVESGSFNKTS